MEKTIKRSGKYKYFMLCVAVAGISWASFGVPTYAQTNDSAPKVDYKGQPPVDSDLDGLTDAAEIQIYHTDPTKADTDGDGWFDGTEVTNGSDPLNKSSVPGTGIVPDQQASQPVKSETPWAWYISRSSALVAFALLYISIFLGLTLRLPLLRKIFSPVYSLDAHCWISLYATMFAFLHAIVLVFDKFFKLTLADLFIPFASSFQPNFMAMGIFGFYLMVILLVTSYGRKHISQKLWRITHFTNIALYAVVLGHAWNLGTDMKNPLVAGIFLAANALLIFIMLWNIELRITDALRRKKT